MEVNEVLKTISSNIIQISKYGIEKIGVFGSIARGETHKESDIDILIEFKHGEKTFDNYMDLKFYLEDLFNGKKIDLVIKNSIKPELKQYILNEVRYAS
jgi:hypothetical protein